MKMKFGPFGALAVGVAGALFFLCASVPWEDPKVLPLIPYPQEVTLTGGTCRVPSQVEALLLPDSLGTALFPTHESYTLEISRRGVVIQAAGEAGLYYGQTTWQQLREAVAEKGGRLPCAVIRDTPRYEWRGMHLDVSRHFFSKEFIMKQLDAMAYYKLNRFHWHLTDGPGWRLEIPQYPELTRVAAWRPYAEWKEWWASPRHYVEEGTPGAYGGYYTAEDVKEVLAYAAARHIMVIPEIEMPGHSEEVIAVYPHLSCQGEPYRQSEFCIGNEDTFTFLENVLSYVMDLFPSPYIHIGGDEASRAHWKTCPKCQQRMKEEGLEDEAQLQSYLVHRIEAFINSKGRQLLGWDEIMDGGLTPHATVMSWRGEEGGIKAAALGHDVIMTPGSHCYLDGYQSNPATEPQAMGGYLPLQKVYSYNPACPALGVQGNVWAEYIPTPQQAEHMMYPRIIALAEVGWTQPEHKDWEHFKVRINTHVPRLRAKGYNAYPLSQEVEVFQKGVVPQGSTLPAYIEVTLATELAPAQIRYTTDATAPTAQSALYTAPLKVRDSLCLNLQLYRGTTPLGPVQTVPIYFHKAIGKPVTYLRPYYPSYAAGGDQALVDGTRGGYSYTDGLWQGFCPRDMDVIIDLGAPTEVSRVTAVFMQVPGPGVFLPSKVEVFGSANGTHYQRLGEQTHSVPTDKPEVVFEEMGWRGKPQTVRYIRFLAHQSPLRAFLFTEEIIVN